MNRDILILAQKEPFRRGISLVITTRGYDRSARRVVMEPTKQGEAMVPAMTISEEAAQKLMDELWTCGLRPSEGSGSAGMLAATQRHLADMQKIVSKSLKIEL